MTEEQVKKLQILISNHELDNLIKLVGNPLFGCMDDHKYVGSNKYNSGNPEIHTEHSKFLDIFFT